MIENRALVSFPSHQEIDKSLKSKKLQISSIFATLHLHAAFKTACSFSKLHAVLVILEGKSCMQFGCSFLELHAELHAGAIFQHAAAII